MILVKRSMKGLNKRAKTCSTQAPSYNPKGCVEIKGCMSGTRPSELGRASKMAKSTHWSQALGDDVLSLSRTNKCFSMIEDDERLDYVLPKRPRSTAGQILKHCFDTLDVILAKQYPCIYKVGYTHCAWFRFYNDVFGYVLDRDRWQLMTVLYAASEVTSPAFVEAALIQREKGCLSRVGVVVSMMNHVCPAFFLLQSPPRKGRMSKHSGWW